MSGFGGADALKMVRNTATLERERVRLRAADNRATPFTASALPLLVLGGGLSGRALVHQGPAWLQLAGVAMLLGGAGALLAGVARRASYLKSHHSDV